MNDQLLLRALSADWGTINYQQFAGTLRSPVLALADTTAFLGRWDPSNRTLTLARSLVEARPWGEVVEVLRHETAHQYVTEVLHHHGAAHDALFHQVCEERGIDPRGSGLPDAHPIDAAMDRVRKLLALADSPNRHEAEAAMRRAHRLMLAHNLSHVGQAGRYSARRIGPAKTRFQTWEKRIAGLLGEHFFVRPIWVRTWLRDQQRDGSVLEVLGTPDNLDLAEWVASFLRHTAERLWRAHKRAEGIRGDRDRRSFLTGVITGFSQKLRQERHACEQTGLVWIGDPGLEAFTGARYQHLRTRRAPAVRLGAAFGAGQAAGRGIVLSRPIQQHGADRRRFLEG